MINQELRTYVEAQLARGVEESLIRKTLLEAGWKTDDVETVFSTVLPPRSQPMITPTYVQSGNVKVMPDISSMTSHKGSMKGVFLGIVLFLVFLGGGAFAYVSYFKTPSPRVVFEKMMSALQQVNTFEYNVQANTEGATCTDMQYSFSDAGDAVKVCNSKKPFTNKTTISGVADVSSIDNPTHQLTLTSENTLPNEDDLSEKTSIRLDLISLDKALYVKVSSLVFPLASFFDTTTFTNKWVSVDINGLQKQFLGTDSSLNTELITNEKAKRIKDLFLSADIVTVVESTEDVFEGIPVYKYAFEVSQEQQKNILISIYSTMYDGVNGANGEMTQENINSITESVKSLGIIEGEIWVGKKDFLPYKIVLNPDVVMFDGAFEVTSANTVIEFKNYNVPISVKAPTSAISLDEVMAKLFAPASVVATTTPPIKIIPKR